MNDPTTNCSTHTQRWTNGSEVWPLRNFDEGYCVEMEYPKDSALYTGLPTWYAIIDSAGGGLWLERRTVCGLLMWNLLTFWMRRVKLNGIERSKEIKDYVRDHYKYYGFYPYDVEVGIHYILMSICIYWVGRLKLSTFVHPCAYIIISITKRRTPMPNWCYNRVRIDADSDQVENSKKSMKFLKPFWPF